MPDRSRSTQITCRRRLVCEYRNVLMCFLLFCLLVGCNDSSIQQYSSAESQEFIEIDEINVPVFSTAEEQLNYTRSWFAETQEKRSALRAFRRLYPEEKKSSGVAALELAYLQLGNDFRFALEHDCFAAIKDYREILVEYQEFDEISAKALWYIGWIYSNLLNDKEKGINHYIELANTYPREQVSLLPPAPWVSIIYEADETINTALYNQQMNHWAALALFEIIQHSGDADQAWQAFDTLWQKYRQDKATGFALKVILKRRFQVEKALARARQYMEKDFSNVHILGDIQKEINTIAGSGGGA